MAAHGSICKPRSVLSLRDSNRCHSGLLGEVEGSRALGWHTKWRFHANSSSSSHHQLHQLGKTGDLYLIA